MERKFKILDDVLIQAAYTGIGEVKASIVNYSFSKTNRCWFYDAKDSKGNRYHVAEHHLEKYRVTSEIIREEARSEFYKDRPATDKPYEASFVLGWLSNNYDFLLDKYEKLEAKYNALKMQEELLNPIS